jgi:hypothetical protein
MIAQYLLDNFDNKIRNYFLSDDWKNVYQKKLVAIDHDEPWLTLISSYALFGNMSMVSLSSLDAINFILNASGISNKINFTSIDNIKVEKKTREIPQYRDYLCKIYENTGHLYPDRNLKIVIKLTDNKASFEGNTNIDLVIEGTSNSKKTVCFIEAKFLSDISYQIKYNPVRDQIIRNIDCGIDHILENHFKGIKTSFADFYFFLLTPGIFRPELFGKMKGSVYDRFDACSSRLYCYKMKEYKDWRNIKNRFYCKFNGNYKLADKKSDVFRAII